MARKARDADRIIRTPEQARGGQIVLRQRWQRIVFIGGLAGAAILALILAVAAAVRPA